jgi:SLT domain-containing protein
MITLAVEMLGVGLFALLAGIDRDAGKVMVTIMGGLWLIYAITNDKVITGLGNALDKATNGEG